MFVGPIFSREVLTAPRQFRHYLIRSGYVAALFVLVYTIRMVTIGFQNVTNIEDDARFGNFVFQVLSVVQLLLVSFFAMLFAANNVSQEKDKQTLIILLMTDLADRELVLGKLSASLLNVFVLIAVSAPVFFFVHLLGGVSAAQIVWSLGICAATALLAGSWGSLVAYWREKTFQTLSISVLGVVLLIGLTEVVVGIAGVNSPLGSFAGLFNPYRALLSVMSPLSTQSGLDLVRVSALQSVGALTGLAVVLNGIAIWRLRAWNPSRSVFKRPETEVDRETGQVSSKVRAIWRNPVVWREIRTKAYGRKVALIKLVYVFLAAFGLYALTGGSGEVVLGMISPGGLLFVGLSLMSLLLVNVQAVTAMTTERDMKTLELLLMTDISAREFIFGKLGGILFNGKELILIPLLMAGWFVFQGLMPLETFVFVTIGFLVLVGFAAMLGLHSGLSYDISRNAIANSLGTMFFLFVGIFLFMLLLIEANSSFILQFQSFIVFIGLGSLALYFSLSRKNPSTALKIAAGCLPFFTFYAITQFLLRGTLGVCLSVMWAYGFATVAMLVPAVSEFDTALGRTTLDQG